MFYNKKSKNKFVEKYKNNYLTVINLTKQYKRNMPPAISNLNFHVGPGEFHAFIGGNGAGKTTSIKSIVGAYAKYSGEIYFCGHLNTTIQAKRIIGYIPEIARFPENMSVSSYLKNMALLSGIKRKDVKGLVDKILVDLNMNKLSHKSPNSFSSGQKKKILLAQALLHDPKILIMDEPAANLDPRARIEFFNKLKKLQNSGKSILISSHILGELDKYATHATILDGGKIVFSESLEKYRNKYENKYIFKFKNVKKAKQFLKSKNLIFEFDDIKNVFAINLKDNIQQFINDLFINSIELISFSVGMTSLEDIFYNYVIKGSVHTMNENLNKK